MRIKAVPRSAQPVSGTPLLHAGRRRRLPHEVAFAAVSAVIGVALFASATPTPLYDVYQLRWHFSTPVLTLVYATYALGVLGSLLMVGGLSDQVGRRPVLAWSLTRPARRRWGCSWQRARSCGCSSRADCKGSPPAARWAPRVQPCSTFTHATTRATWRS